MQDCAHQIETQIRFLSLLIVSITIRPNLEDSKQPQTVEEETKAVYRTSEAGPVVVGGVGGVCGQGK